MAVSEDVTVQDGGPENLRIPPHVSALVRWCISCLWRAASIILHRLMAPPLPHLPALMRSESVDSRNGTRERKHVKRSVTRRQPSTEHICEEPKVECVILHEPECDPTMDIIFVHGLYGSLANTWRQGDWRNKYKFGPKMVPLRNHPRTQCHCEQKDSKIYINDIYCNETNEKVLNNFNYNRLIEKLNDEFKNEDNNNFKINKDVFFDKVLQENKIFGKNFAKELMDQVQIVDNYGTDEFIEKLIMQNLENSQDFKESIELFGKDTEKDVFLVKNDDFEEKLPENEEILDNGYQKLCECEIHGNTSCLDGCGCVCNKCYSKCWPRDWLRVDHPDSRVISINYTSDPYLWRPIWVKESKRLQLPERAEQMTKQLLDLGVGERPIIWVGHSKGGLFIKQIYSKAYDAHMKLVNENSHIETYRPNDFTMKFNELKRRATLWSHSAGFMFYSVPHRGSSLADFNIPPITARSIELLEISKDCSSVLALQDRWLKAAKQSSPAVRSLVETCRTLMAVLWLRIVSEESADAGVGALCGVSVDHREICKPSSRNCPLYTELLELIDTAVNKCQCGKT